MYKLFIDDGRYPVTNDWVIVRSSSEAIEYVKKFGFPEYISFDHDLGGEDTSMIFIHWMIDSYLDGNISIPDNFDFHVHSQNPIGKSNIKSLLYSFIAHNLPEREN